VLDPKCFEDVVTFAVARNTCRLISGKDRRTQTMLGNSQYIHKKLYRPRQCFSLEVITQRPVTHHLKHREMPFISNIFDIIGADTTLDIVQTLTEWMRFTDKIWDKLLHPCNVE
jgi:hypothetical protein